uniref:L-amino-acid oxidase n=1 Tax=Oncorhynchus kisutch TaxID=8019 RepID=A0A8C7DX94_ONCKI
MENVDTVWAKLLSNWNCLLLLHSCRSTACNSKVLFGMCPNTVLVVVGAGEAGLSAASTLVKAGFQQVQVLEAMSRPGGRPPCMPCSLVTT